MTADGHKVYVANVYNNSVSVIATAMNTVIDTISVGVGSDDFELQQHVLTDTAKKNPRCFVVRGRFSIILPPARPLNRNASSRRSGLLGGKEAILIQHRYQHFEAIQENHIASRQHPERARTEHFRL